jgi:ABC-type multidrug transport system ATPase subunit
MIEIDGLTKRYGDKTAVDRLSFVVEPGVVTGFLGPNGAGKSTTAVMPISARVSRRRCRNSVCASLAGGRDSG